MNKKILMTLFGMLIVILVYTGLEMFLTKYFVMEWYYLLGLGVILAIIFHKNLG